MKKRQRSGLVHHIIHSIHSSTPHYTYVGQVGLGVLGILFGLAVGTNV